MNKTNRLYQARLIDSASDLCPYDVFHLISDARIEIFIIRYGDSFEDDFRKRQIAMWLVSREESQIPFTWAELDVLCAYWRAKKIHVL